VATLTTSYTSLPQVCLSIYVPLIQQLLRLFIDCPVVSRVIRAEYLRGLRGLERFTFEFFSSKIRLAQDAGPAAVFLHREELDHVTTIKNFFHTSLSCPIPGKGSYCVLPFTKAFGLA
jgi:hypothetical protein